MLYDSPMSGWPILLLILALLAVSIWMAWRERAALPRRILAWIIALRSALVVLLGFLVLNPYWVEKEPNPEGYEIALLADVSESMAVEDTNDGARLDTLKKLIDPEATFWQQLGNPRAWSFVHSIEPLVAEPTLQAGSTAIGDALDSLRLHYQDQPRALGAVVLLSDGISLRGEAVTEAAKRFRQAGIPVSTIGIGEPTVRGDASIRFSQAPAKSPVAEPIAFTLDVANTGTAPIEREVELLQGDRSLATTRLTVPPGGQERLSFSHTPEQTGVATYRARLAGGSRPDGNPNNDVDYAVVEVTPPESLEVLFLSNRLGYTYRYLSIMARQSEQLRLDAIIRTGEERFFVRRAEDDGPALEGFPDDPEGFLPYRVLIIDTRVLAELPAPTLDALRSFLVDRAGGILFIGPPAATPQAVQPLLPVRETELRRPDTRIPLVLEKQPVFSDAAGGVLFMQPHVFLPPELPVALNLRNSLGARVAATTQSGHLPVLTIQAYGPGRSAYLGTEGTWRWQTSSARGDEQHRLFWHYLLGWLGAGGNALVETPLQATVQSVGEPLPLDVRVRGRDFRPSADARVVALLRHPDGREQTITLTPSPYEEGLYTARTPLEEAGEYRVEYRVSRPGESPESHRAYFLATRQGRENEETSFRESTLLEMARITGGRYAHANEAAALFPLELASGLPMLAERVYWTRNVYFLILLFLIAGSEWLLRRRAGLR